MSYHNVPIGRTNNVNKSSKVIERNLPYCSNVKVPIVSGHQGYQTLLEKSALVSYYQVENQYKQRVSLSIYHTVTHTQLQHLSERGAGIRERTVVGDHLIVFGFYYSHWCSFYLQGSYGVFSFMVFPRKIFVSIVSCD